MKSLKDALTEANVEARESGLHLRIFNAHYAKQGIAQEITDTYVKFPAGAFEVRVTGPLSGAATAVDKLIYPTWITIQSISEFELTPAVGAR